MTTPQPAALPELPRTTYSLFYDQPGDLEDEGYQYVLDEPGYTADQMRAYALAALQSQPAAETALQKFVRLKVADEVRSPLEQLRSFCSFAMSGQDWIDCEPFFDAIVESAQPAAAGVSDADVWELRTPTGTRLHGRQKAATSTLLSSQAPITTSSR